VTSRRDRAQEKNSGNKGLVYGWKCVVGLTWGWEEGGEGGLWIEALTRVESRAAASKQNSRDVILATTAS
jgi:hypothetical protein